MAKHWKITNDAEALREAEEIKADKKRHKRALKALRKQVKNSRRAGG